MHNVKTFKNLSTNKSVAWVTPEPYFAKQEKSGLMHKGKAPYAFIVTNQGISISEDSRISTVTDANIEQFKICLNAANKIYLSQWTV